MRRVASLFLAIVLVLSCISEITVVAGEESVTYCKPIDTREVTENSFELGNSTLAIFQGGIQVTKPGVDYYAYKEGLYDRINDKYLTEYQVHNLNYFDGVLYYSVSEESGNSRIEKYNLETGEIDILYDFPYKMGELYCISNKYILFTSEGRLFQIDINSNDIQEIDYGIKERHGIDVWGLVPTINGNILIGGDDFDYSIFVNGNLFLKHVYHVYEEKGFLIVSYDGQLSKVRVKVLFDFFDTAKYSSSIFDCESNRHDRLVSGSGVPDKQSEKNEETDYSFLLEECDIYAETTIDCLFEEFNQDYIPVMSERITSYKQGQDGKSADVVNNSNNDIPDYDPNLHDEIWTTARVSSLKSYLEFLTKIQSIDATEIDKKARSNIIMNARTLMEFPWTMKVGKMIPAWRGGETAFYSGQTYYGAPYHQTGAYVGFDNNTVKDFIVASKENPQFYADHFYNGKQCPYYGVDCSSFVSYALNISERKLTGDLENEQNKILMLSGDNNNNGSEILEKLEPGYFLVQGGTHCKLIAAVYRVENRVKVVATLESQSWTTSSRCNINLYGAYSDILDLIQKSDYTSKDIDKWLVDVINTNNGSPKSLDDLIYVIEKEKGGYNLCGPKKWERIEHNHDCGITIQYNATIADDLCCDKVGTDNCYYKNHGISLNGAHHWDGGNPTNNRCVFCNEPINHTYSNLLSIGADKHRRYCLICKINDDQNHTIGYREKNATYHIAYCTDGCGYEREELHMVVPGTNVCACGYLICNHRFTYVILDASGHASKCTICGEEHGKVSHDYEARQIGEAIPCDIPDTVRTLDMGTSAIIGIDSGVSYGHKLVCKECGYEKEGIIPHSIIIEDAVKQGCHKYCNECGYEEYYDHDYTAYKVTKEATCTEKGEKYRTCKTCGHVHVKGIPATGHDYSRTERKEPLCKENGYERIVCSKCGDIDSETIIPFPGHDYGSPTIISKETCTEPGRRTKKCKTCGFVKEYNYPDATGHNYETKTVDATCTEDGYTREVCSCCGDIKSETIHKKTGHSFGSYVETKEPTCTTKGTKTKTCSACGLTKTKSIGIIEHDYSAATCTSPKKCKMCGITTGSALDHSFSGGYIDYDDTYHAKFCDRCGYANLLSHTFKKGVCRICGHDRQKEKAKRWDKMGIGETTNEEVNDYLIGGQDEK